MHQDAFQEYLQYEKRYSQHTVLAYQTDLKQFFEFLSDAYEIDDLKEVTHTVVRAWVVALMDSGITARSINRKLSTLKSYYRYLRREGAVEVNPMLKVQSPKVPKRLPTFVEEKSMEHLLDRVEFDDDLVGQRDKLILELLYATGMRVSELVNLKSSDVDFSTSTVKVLGKRSKERIIPLPAPVLDLVDHYETLKEQANMLDISAYLLVGRLGKKLNRQFVYQVVNRYLRMVTTARKKSPHVLRHTFATHMLNHGADLNAIKELLGHANLAATQVYTHNTIEKLKNIHKKAHPKG